MPLLLATLLIDDAVADAAVDAMLPRLLSRCCYAIRCCHACRLRYDYLHAGLSVVYAAAMLARYFERHCAPHACYVQHAHTRALRMF